MRDYSFLTRKSPFFGNMWARRDNWLEKESKRVALRKMDVIEQVATGTGFWKKESTEVVEALLEIIKGTLASGEDVLVSGFGKFCVKEKKERKGRNPATGEVLMLGPRKVVTFKCSGKLRERVNGK